MAADVFQPTTWYTGSKSVLYRSMDDGEGWAAAGEFPGQVVYSVQGHAAVPGLIAVCTHDASGAEGSRVQVSWDCGESWQEKAVMGFTVEDMAWALRDGASLLFLATTVGLFELSMQAGAAPVQVYVRPDDQQIGYYAVAVASSKSGVSVAVAARKMGGVFLSSEGGKGNTFRNIEMAGEDVRVLAVQYDGDRAFLWAGLAAFAGNYWVLRIRRISGRVSTRTGWVAVVWNWLSRETRFWPRPSIEGCYGWRDAATRSRGMPRISRAACPWPAAITHFSAWTRWLRIRSAA